MSETTTETPATTNSQAEQAGWQAAAAASAEAQRPEDPPPKYGVEELECQLTDREHARKGIEYATAQNELEAFDEGTKSLVAERKAERAKLEENVKSLKTAALTGRVKRKVRTALYTSLAQNRKWKVRLDTKEQLEEQPLASNERQGNLPLPKDEQLSLEDANEGYPGDDEDLDEDELEEGDEDDADLVAELDESKRDELQAVASGAPVQDSTTNLTGDPDQADPTAITQPADVLAGKAAKKTTKKSKES